MDIATYMFLVEAEEDKWGGAIYVNDTEKLPNQDKMEHLAKYIEKFFGGNGGCNKCIKAYFKQRKMTRKLFGE